MKLLYWLVNLLFPPKCILCRRILRKEETDLCRKCRIEAPEYPFGLSDPSASGKTGLHFLDSFTAVWYYEGNVRASLLRYKFRHARHLAGAYGRLLAMKVAGEFPQSFDYLTWVPVSRRRRRRRGYDQSELLALAAGRELGMTPLRLLNKMIDNPPQSGTSGPMRKANVLGVYEVNAEYSLKGKHILLVDDILTTGATAEECARMLTIAGAETVRCAVVAATRQKKQPSR